MTGFRLLALIAPLTLAQSSSFVLPIDTTLVIAGEDVNFTGNVHVVTKLAPVDPCSPTDPCKMTVQVNMHSVSGISASGQTYIVAGAEKISEADGLAGSTVETAAVGFKVVVPPNPVSPVVIPTPPPIRVDSEIQINDQGAVDSVSATMSIHSCGVDACP